METAAQEGNKAAPEIINPNEHHMALVFVLDTSGSMTGDPIKALNEGLNRFKAEVCKNAQTRGILDVALIEFNSTYKVVQYFLPVEEMYEVKLVATGTTKMAGAIREALKMVSERCRFYRRMGTEPYKPWVMLVTDGAPDKGDDIEGVAQEIKAMEGDGKVSVRSLGIGAFDPKVLHTLCGEKVLKMEGQDFTNFFDWVNKSMRSVSQSSPGEKPAVVMTEGNLYVDRTPNFD